MSGIEHKVSRDQYHKRFMDRASREFVNHGIARRTGDDRWLLQRRHPDTDKFDWTMSAEVVCLAGGRLYVGGDIFPVIFAYCSDPGIQRVRWMGGTTDLNYYVAQKASLGFGGDELVSTYSAEVARSDLDDLAHEFQEIRECHPDDPMLVSIREAHRFADEGHQELYRFLRSEADRHEVPDFMEERYGLGKVLSPRIYYAWAALARLIQLLDQEEEHG